MLGLETGNHQIMLICKAEESKNLGEKMVAT